MNKNKSRGFTLIELLITIALMLSLLAGAIVSFIKISDAKKEEAYRLVKDQILTAGEQYFNSNIYLFEGMEDGAIGEISLGKLVSEDYLNKVTDPRTGKALSKCTYVVVKKENGKIKAKEFKDADRNTCDEVTQNMVSVTELDGPEKPVIITKCNGKKKNVWCGSSVDVNIYVNDNGNGTIKSIKRTGYDGTNSYSPDSVYMYDGEVLSLGIVKKENDKIYKNDDEINEDINSRLIRYTAINEYGKTSYNEITLSIDQTPPTDPNVVLAKWLDNKSSEPTSISGLTDYTTGQWSNKYIYTEASGSLDTGVRGIYYQYKKGGDTTNVNEYTTSNIVSIHANGTSWIEYRACDALDNCTIGVKKENIKIDKTPPSCSSSVVPTNSGKSVHEASDKTKWYNIETGAPIITLIAKDSLSGIEEKINQNVTYNGFTIREGKNVEYKYTFTDNAGNPANCSVSVSYDKTSPTCGTATVAPTNSGKETHNDWYNIETGAPKVTFSVSDTLSGIEGSKTETVTSKKQGASVKVSSSKFYDQAGNPKTCSKTVKYDKTSPTCGTATVAPTNSGKETHNDWYNIETGAPKVTFSVSDTLSGIEGSKTETVTSKKQGASVKVSSSKFYDQAGNPKTCSEIVKYDKTRPVFDDNGGGKIHCKLPGTSTYLSWGYSIKFHDNLSGATATMTKYYSSPNCRTFGWYNNNSSKSNNSKTPSIFSVFAGCSNNPSPKAKFKLVDGAGNYSSEITVTAATTNISSSYNKECDGTIWFDKNR